MSRVGSTIPATGPSNTPATVYATIETQAQPVQDALGQLGNDNKHSNVEQSFAYHVDGMIGKL